ncbi:hypothetical protein XELAEV_18014706mg [Xenopus laevis]|uniref:Uncharacterized protein n=1 Tax=Xenopus laevis TaxID=8355 RepID=A0A974DJ99_XENLA|nr:hypothetical protein XELAEV_18014706mg [Xenopus laevis]
MVLCSNETNLLNFREEESTCVSAETIDAVFMVPCRQVVFPCPPPSGVYICSRIYAVLTPSTRNCTMFHII